MRKIINGKMYNTEAAQHRGYAFKAAGRVEIPHDSTAYETLYLKTNGEYFLGISVSYHSHTLTPMSAVEALAWSEANLCAEDFIRYNGEVSE